MSDDDVGLYSESVFSLSTVTGTLRTSSGVLCLSGGFISSL